MKILSVNAGSSSLKFTLFELPEKKELISGVFEKIGIGNSFYTIKLNGEKIKREVDLRTHGVAVNYLIEELINNKIISSLDDLDGVGHRIVNGGMKFNKTVLITEEVVHDLEGVIELAPVHNPGAVMGIKAFREHYLILRKQLYLTLRFIKLWSKKNSYMQYLMNGIQTTV